MRGQGSGEGREMERGLLRMECMRFADRTEAGDRLAEVLSLYRHARPIVLAISREAQEVAEAVGRDLGAPVDVLLAAAIGAPHRESRGLGAVADPGIHVLHRPVLRMLGMTETEIERLVTQALVQLSDERRRLCGVRPLPDLAGHTAILVDDGLASDSAARAAVRGARLLGATRVVVAAPIGFEAAIEALAGEADEVVCIETLEEVERVGAHYASAP
jgi:predicted phosphoribosyltransferase